MRKKWCIQLTLVRLFLEMERQAKRIKTIIDGEAAAVVVFLSVSGLLDTLAANANGKRTCTPFSHSHLTVSSQPNVHVFELWEKTGEPGDNPHLPRTFFFCHEKVLPLIQFIIKFKILCPSLNVYKDEPLD